MGYLKLLNLAYIPNKRVMKYYFFLYCEDFMRGTGEGLVGGMSRVTSSGNYQVCISHVLVAGMDW